MTGLFIKYYNWIIYIVDHYMRTDLDKRNN